MSGAEIERRREFPPFEKTLAGLGRIPADAALDATIGREVFSETLAAHSLPAAAHRGLPTVSIDLGTGNREASAMEERPVDLVVVGKLGEGGMGVVHLAEQRSLERLVAVKTTRSQTDDVADAALCEEAIVTGRLEHPNVIPVHAFGRTSEGRAAIVMKRIEGVEWRALLADPDHPNWAEIGTGDRLVDHLQILTQIANALAFAHSRGVVHRDVKPENVLVGNYGEVILVDFGVAARIDREWPEELRVVGTPVYMAPEMVEGTRVDERTDVYLLGATLHEILTGEPPHDGNTLPEVLACAYLSSPKVFDGSVPHELAEICGRALCRDPADRYPTARAFRHAISEFVAHRASYRLADRARERWLDAKSADSLAARRVAFSEARFAARQAVEQWKGNHAARTLLHDATLDALALELGERNAVGARALAGSLESLPESLRIRLEELDATLDAERRGIERLREIQHDLDTSVGAGARRNIVLVMSLVVVGVGALVARHTATRELRPRDFVVIGLGMVVVTTILLGASWRRVAVNAVSRRILILGWLSSVVLTVHRLVAWVADDRTSDILATDSLLFASMCLGAAVTIDSKAAYVIPFPVAGAFFTVAFPQFAAIAFSVSTLALLLAAALYFSTLSRKEPS